eukprot:Opistho-2@67558
MGVQDYCKTRIICTVGPETASVEVLQGLIEAGMDVLRVNMSHSTAEFARQVMVNLAKARTPSGKEIGVCFDLNGPKIRTGKLKDGKAVQLQAGSRFHFMNKDVEGDETQISTTYHGRIVSPGDKIFVDDGRISFTVVAHNGDDVETIVDNSGMLHEHKGVNIPMGDFALSAISEQDAKDIALALDCGVDFIAQSNVRSASDVMEVRMMLGNARVKVIAKIENKQGLERVDEILKVSDGLMLMRGYLGVEVPIETIALVQKQIVNKCNLAGKPVIIADQVLVTMVKRPIPTRAESTDTFNAVIDGTDGLMLSAETAIGAYPMESVRMCRKICHSAEQSIDYEELYYGLRRQVKLPIPVFESVASSAVKSARDVAATAIITITDTGRTARALSKYRPAVPVLVVTPNAATARQCQISKSLLPIVMAFPEDDQNDPSDAAIEQAVRLGYVRRNDNIIVLTDVIDDVNFAEMEHIMMMKIRQA